MALAWLLLPSGVTAPIIGPRTMEQLDGALRAVALNDDALRPPRRASSQAPGGTAPEAYAW